MRSLVAFLVLAAVLAPAAAGAKGHGAVVDRVAMVVNGVPIFASEIARREADMAVQTALGVQTPGDQASPPSTRALDSLIEEALMIAGAREMGIAVTAAEVERAVAQIMKDNNLDEAAFTAALAGQRMTLGEYREDVERRLLFVSVQEVMMRGALLVSETQVRDGYEREKALGTLGTFEQERDRIYGQLYQLELVKLMQTWLAGQRATAYIETRAP